MDIHVSIVSQVLSPMVGHEAKIQHTTAPQNQNERKNKKLHIPVQITQQMLHIPNDLLRINRTNQSFKVMTLYSHLLFFLPAATALPLNSSFVSSSSKRNTKTFNRYEDKSNGIKSYYCHLIQLCKYIGEWRKKHSKPISKIILLTNTIGYDIVW